MNRFLFLGCGSSLGVPVVGCQCPVCTGKKARNLRLRPSLLLEVDNNKILIDATPDFREQALKYGLSTLDGALLTHLHYDHMGGLDDLRVFSFFQKKPFPILLSASVLEEIKKRFDYLLKGEEMHDFDLHLLEGEMGVCEFLGLSVSYFTYFQGKTPVTGYRINDLAYLTDISVYSEDIFKHLQGVQVLIISALKEKKTSVHFGIKEALNFASKINPKQLILTHLAHEVDYDVVQKKLSAQVFLAYDGLAGNF